MPIRAPKYSKQKLSKLKGETDNNTNSRQYQTDNNTNNS